VIQVDVIFWAATFQRSTLVPSSGWSGSLKCWYPTTTLYGVTTKKTSTWNITSVKVSKFTSDMVIVQFCEEDKEKGKWDEKNASEEEITCKPPKGSCVGYSNTLKTILFNEFLSETREKFMCAFLFHDDNSFENTKIIFSEQQHRWIRKKSIYTLQLFKGTFVDMNMYTTLQRYCLAD
jgi:hypothetical protein